MHLVFQLIRCQKIGYMTVSGFFALNKHAICKQRKRMISLCRSDVCHIILYTQINILRKRKSKKTNSPQVQNPSVSEQNKRAQKFIGVVKSKIDKKSKTNQDNKKLSNSVKNKMHQMKQALNKQTKLKGKLKSCSKHLQNLRQKDEREFITINEIYDSYGAVGGEVNTYDNIDENSVYDDPMQKSIVQIFEDEGKITVKKLLEILENEYEEIENHYYEVVDEIADLVDTNTYEDIDDSDNLYDYIDTSKLEEIKRANKERKQIQAEKGTVKTVLQNLNRLDQEEIILIEDIYAMPNKFKSKEKKEKSDSKTEEVYSIYVKQMIEEKFGNQKHGKVRDLINLFEGKMENLNEKQDKIINHMTRMVEEETKELEMVENEVYEEFNNRNKEPERVLKALKQINSNAVVSLENMKIKTQKGKMLNNALNIEPDEAMKERIKQKYGEVGEIPVKELIALFNNEFKPDYDKVIKEMSKGVSMKAKEGNLKDENDGKDEFYNKPVMRKTRKDDQNSTILVDNELYSSGVNNNSILIENELYSSACEMDNDTVVIENELYVCGKQNR